MTDVSDYTTRLFAMPSYLSGFARTLDIAGLFDSYNRSDTPAQADFDALRADFRAIAEDFKAALETIAPSAA
jgi:hypothetical protein